MKECMKDQGQSLLEIMIECPDMLSRVNVMHLLVYVLKRLSVVEKDYLFDMEEIEIDQKDDKGEVTKVKVEYRKSICS